MKHITTLYLSQNNKALDEIHSECNHLCRDIDFYNYFISSVWNLTKTNTLMNCILDCAAIKKSGITTSGVYRIDPDGKGPMNVYCDMATDGGGWTVIQRREDGSVDFYLDWASYKRGFGTLAGEFWLGNDNIHRRTAAGNTVLRVELEDWDANTAHAVYGSFKVDGESNKYKLTATSYSGTAGDSLDVHNGRYFTTKDRDNDESSSGNCAHVRKGGWWYQNCSHSNLNGQYLGNMEDSATYRGLYWWYWKYRSLSMKITVMKIRPPVI